MSSGQPSETAQVQARSNQMAASGSPSEGDLNIQTTPNVGTGVQLSAQQKLVAGSVLDLFKGLPSLQKLQLWTDDATFSDPITKAEGRKQYSAQWYGLKTAFSEIEQISQTVTSDKNPMVIDLKTRYKLAGLESEKTMESQVHIWTTVEGLSKGQVGAGNDGKLRITKVEDRWNGGELPEGPFAKAFRNLNSVVVPAMVGVPKTEAEDVKKQSK